jgi:hypothetical protein
MRNIFLIGVLILISILIVAPVTAGINGYLSSGYITDGRLVTGSNFRGYSSYVESKFATNNFDVTRTSGTADFDLYVYKPYASYPWSIDSSSSPNAHVTFSRVPYNSWVYPFVVCWSGSGGYYIQFY